MLKEKEKEEKRGPGDEPEWVKLVLSIRARRKQDEPNENRR